MSSSSDGGSRDQAEDQANQDRLIADPIIWHRNYPPPAQPPEHSIVSIWLVARHLWEQHHDSEDGHCITCTYPRVPAPCPDQVLAQHVMVQAIILGNGSQSLAMVRTLAREADAWRFVAEPNPSGAPREATITGLNVPSTYHISDPR